MPKEDSKRRPNFTSGEIDMIESQVETRRATLFGKFSSSVTHELKCKEWEKVAVAVNRIAPNKRTGEEIRKKWENVKSKGKAQLALKYNKTALGKTGGGSPTVQLPTPREERLISLIGTSSIVGISQGIDSSRDSGPPTPMSLIEDDDGPQTVSETDEVPPDPRSMDEFGRKADTPQRKSVSEKLLDAQKELCGILTRTNELMEISIIDQREFNAAILQSLNLLIQTLSPTQAAETVHDLD